MMRFTQHTQRTRRLLNQGAMQRSHRRGELIRSIPEEIETSNRRVSDPASRAKDRKTTETPI